MKLSWLEFSHPSTLPSTLNPYPGNINVLLVFCLRMATDSSTPPQKSGGMTALYANLLDSSSASTPGSISRAPVTFQQQAPDASSEQDDAAKKQQALAGRSKSPLERD